MPHLEFWPPQTGSNDAFQVPFKYQDKLDNWS